ncbi:hypothetical protein HTZ77_04800 [Nonomuraea sp. SMC257]|uniref:Uncharacterized protein n=1 Tax=Nonomuraea montanisoli TaxID=2741721 RepID=A0A7Y6I2Y3_9ACTN|nr:hypothetical protein [Nonomuraea montanisoli]NUW30742.1 hypothetical protein [Nonomuraea montanisoli]
MDLTSRYEINQEIGHLSELARYYDYHGRTDVAQQYKRQLANLQAMVARAQLIDGLRALADFLDTHPDVPTNSWAHVSYSVTANDVDGGSEDAKRAEVGRVAAILGVTPTLSDSGSHYTALRTFGPVEFRATAITQEHMAMHEASGTYYGAVTP